MPIRLPIVSKFDSKGVDQAKSALGGFGSFAKGAGALVATAFAAGTAAVGAFAIQSVRAADESWKVAKALEQAAKNSGVFGSTEADIKKATGALAEHAQKLGELTGIDDEVLLSIEKTWMAVPELAGLGTAGIENLAQVTADVAAGTGKDIESIGLAFVKIAGDEETALGKLAKAGVVFTDEQKNTYQAMLDANDAAGAQAYLIGELGKKYEGMAKASASPLERINQMWTNFQETIGTALMPALEQLAPMLGTALGAMVADPEFQQFLIDLGQAFVDILPSLIDVLPPLMDLVQAVLPLLVSTLPSVTGLIQALTPVIQAMTPVLQTWLDFWDALLSPLETAGHWIEAINNHISQGTDVRRDLTNWAKNQSPIIQTLTDWFLRLATALADVGKWWRELLGLPAPEIPGGNGPVRAYSSGGLKLAAGGVVLPRPGGTMATIGEAGQAEAVIPLDRLDKMVSGGGGGGGYIININGGLASSADIGRAVVDAIKKFERTSGPVFASA